MENNHITITRYGKVGQLPVLEQVRWTPAEEGDPRGMALPSYDGLWIWTAGFNLFIDSKWLGQDIVHAPESDYWNLYALPLRPDITIVKLEEFEKLTEVYKTNQNLEDNLPLEILQNSKNK
jgi:hypothetical protein